MSIYIGLDIGGTKLLVASADASGNIVRRSHRPTPLALDEGLSALHEMVAQVAQDESIAAFGAAAGGPLDWKTGVISPLHQPQWRDVPLKAIFEDRYGCPLAVDVDTNVAALGELRFGGGDSVERLVYVTVSTGVGGGYLVGGEVYRGSSGAHPEVGHQSIAFRCRYPERIVCACGAGGCLEALVSGNAIRRIYLKPAEELDAAEWDEVAYNLGQGLRNIATIYAPDVIVLGGGVAVGGGEALISRARQVMADNLKIVPTPAVRLSRLGGDTALCGAIALAINTAEATN